MKNKDCKIPLELTGISDLKEIVINKINESGIYFLCKNKEIVYIGKSLNITQRIGIHLFENEKDFDEVFYILYKKNTLDIIEFSLIRHFQPKYNLTVPKIIIKTKLEKFVLNSFLKNIPLSFY